MINTISPSRPGWNARQAEAEIANDRRPAEKLTASSRIADVDPFDAADTEFDFDAADKAAAATMLRDQQQMKLAEMADVRAQGSVSVQAAMAAYREFDE